MTEPDVWAGVVGQPDAVSVLRAAAGAAAELVAGAAPTRRFDPASGSQARRFDPASGSQGSQAMTHAWLFTGPPGSGRSVAARSFAAALECVLGTGCGQCPGCRTTMAGTHADVRLVVPEGLSISVAEMRALVQAAARRPTGGRWQVVIVEDADRLTEGAANALLKAVEEPPARTVFLLCAPSDHPDDVSVTIRSRCRVMALRAPAASAIAQVLAERDGVEPETARWAASVCGGHIGRARRLATDPAARDRRAAVLRVPMALRGLGDVFSCADELVQSAEAEASTVSGERDTAERAALETAMGAGGTGKGTAAASRGAKGALKELERRQKSRATRTQRDALDLALIDLAGFYRDVLVTATGSTATLNHPDRGADVRRAAASWTPESALHRLEAVLACREAIDANVKPRIAVEAMLTSLLSG